jgi:hypothetical protein
MHKKLITVCLSLFLASIMFSGIAIAGAANCTVDSVSGSKVMLDCGSKADNFETGDSVKVKKSKKRKVIEGC